jgi:Phage integrase, N-terminal SAM-like domain
MATSAILTTAATSGGKEWSRRSAWRRRSRLASVSPDTRKGYQRDLHCWLEFCAANRLHPYRDVRRAHVEVYLRQLEQHAPGLANATLQRRISTLSPWSPGSKTKTSTSAFTPAGL